MREGPILWALKKGEGILFFGFYNIFNNKGFEKKSERVLFLSPLFPLCASMVLIPTLYKDKIIFSQIIGNEFYLMSARVRFSVPATNPVGAKKSWTQQRTSSRRSTFLRGGSVAPSNRIGNWNVQTFLLLDLILFNFFE